MKVTAAANANSIRTSSAPQARTIQKRAMHRPTTKRAASELKTQAVVNARCPRSEIGKEDMARSGLIVFINVEEESWTEPQTWDAAQSHSIVGYGA